MNAIGGAIRMAALVLLVLGTALLTGCLTLFPVSLQGIPAQQWAPVLGSRLFLRLFNVRVLCNDLPALRRHQGLLFPNHHSYLEALALFSLTPVRYLAAHEARRIPVVGWLADRVGTLFVKRESREDRSTVRRAIADLMAESPYPPLVVFPEGKLGLGRRLNPYRHGIFEAAIMQQIPYLICAVRFSHFDVAVWRGSQGESLPAAVWRLATFPEQITVDIIVLDKVHPTPHADPAQLAAAARKLVSDTLGFPL